MSVQSTRNQKIAQEGQKKSKAKQYGGSVTRLATMPVGVVKDMMQGGLIQAGKNFIPRMRNIVTGSTLTNRAEVKPRKGKTTTTETSGKANEAAERATEQIERAQDKATSNTSSDRENISSGDTTLRAEDDDDEDNSEKHKD